jgi:hypothetical protein
VTGKHSGKQKPFNTPGRPRHLRHGGPRSDG